MPIFDYPRQMVANNLPCYHVSRLYLLILIFQNENCWVIFPLIELMSMSNENDKNKDIIQGAAALLNQLLIDNQKKIPSTSKDKFSYSLRETIPKFLKIKQLDNTSLEAKKTSESYLIYMGALAVKEIVFLLKKMIKLADETEKKSNPFNKALELSDLLERNKLYYKNQIIEAESLLKKIGLVALNQVLELLEDTEKIIRVKSCDVVKKIIHDKNKPVELERNHIRFLAKCFETEKEEDVLTGLHDILKDSGEPAINLLLSSLMNENLNDTVRVRIVKLLADMGLKAANSTSDLAKILRERNSSKELIAETARALGEIGCLSKVAISVLIDLLNDDILISTSNNICKNILFSLGKCGSFASDAMPRMLTIVEPVILSECNEILINGIEVIGNVHTIPNKALPVLQKGLYSKWDKVCIKVLYAIGEYGKEASYLVPEICSLIKNNINREEVCREAGRTLSKINPPEGIIQELTQSLQSRNTDKRCKAAFALGGLGARSLPAVYFLDNLLEDTDINVRYAGAMSLWQIAKAERALLVLGKIASNPEYENWIYVVNFLENIGIQAKPALKLALTDVIEGHRGYHGLSQFERYVKIREVISDVTSNSQGASQFLK